MPETTAQVDDRLVAALALIEEAEENLETARGLIRQLFAATLPEADDVWHLGASSSDEGPRQPLSRG
jgi:hypothetical protein